MIQILELMIGIITGGIILIREIRSLVREHQRPFLYVQPPTQLETTSMIEFQIDMEKLFHKNQLLPRIKAEFQAEPYFEELFSLNQIPEDFGYDLLAQMVLHKRASLPILVGILRRHFEGDTQFTADMLGWAAECDLVDWHPGPRQFIMKYDISPDVKADLERYQYPLPMVVPPKELRSNRDTGYYTGKGSVILKDNHHENDVCLDHLNRLNRIKLRLNQEVASTIKNSWRGLDKPHPDEDISEYQKRIKAFEKYDRTAHDVHAHLGIANGGEFYLTHKVDKRGRTYCQGYHVSYQSASWNKSVIEFANQEVVE